MEAAIWFHDAIYDPRAKDNEEQSAALAETALTTAGIAPEIISQVRSLILITKHTSPPRQPDEILLVDIDLAIIGQARERYEIFEQRSEKNTRGCSPPISLKDAEQSFKTF